MTPRCRQFGRKRLAACLAACLAVGAAAAESRVDEFRDSMRRGLASLRKGDRDSLVEANQLFKVAQRLQPDAADAHFLRALALSDAGSYGYALRQAEKAAAAGHAGATLLCGQLLLYQADDYDAAERYLRQLAQQPNIGSVYAFLTRFNLGRVLYHRGRGPRDYAEAGLYFAQVRAAVRELPSGHPLRAWLAAEEWQALLYQGYCHDALGENLEATAVYLEAKERAPDNVEVRLRLAAAYRRRGVGFLDLARQEWFEALRLDANAYEANLQLAYLMATQSPPDRPGAEVHLDRFLQKAPASHPWRARAERYRANASEP